MSLFRKIRQVFCHHYFVFDANKKKLYFDVLKNMRVYCKGVVMGEIY